MVVNFSKFNFLYEGRQSVCWIHEAHSVTK